MPHATDLHGLAALLRQAAPGDDDTIAALRAGLRACASRRDLPAAARLLADDAARGLDAATTTAARAEALLAARESLDQALALPPDDPLPPDTDPSLLADFVAESREALADAEAALLVLETGPDDRAAIHTVLRAFHTIKGTAGFLGLERVVAFAHQAETLLAGLRDGDARRLPPVTSLALRAVDVLRDLLDASEHALRTGRVSLPASYTETMAAMVAATAEGGVGDGGPRRTPGPAGARAGDRPPRAPGAGDATVRVPTATLDAICDLVGELVVAHAQLAEDDARRDGLAPDLAHRIARTGRIARELRHLAASLRIIPLTPTFRKFARLVRDVAQRAGKAVAFVVDGDDTEVDRGIADLIGDPLVHMLRNAIDHGIESPAERERLGKPRTGVVSLSAVRTDEAVVITLQDDGRGLDPERILAKAVRQGLVAPGTVASPHEAFRLLFAPGFSMAERVTDLSGRGVGLDVVRERIEALRGRVDLESVPGRGTTFTLRIPAAMPAADALILRVGAERYVVHAHHVERSFRPSPEQLATPGAQGEAVTWYGEDLPIVRLHRLHGVPGAAIAPAEGLLLVLRDGDRRAALLVDDLLGRHPIALGPRSAAHDPLPAVVGTVRLGDGGDGFILDVPDLLARARHEPGGPFPEPAGTPSAPAAAA